MTAVDKGHASVVTLLLDAGADVNLAGSVRQAFFYYDCQHSRIER
jgi:hypothetical protein